MWSNGRNNDSDGEDATDEDDDDDDDGDHHHHDFNDGDYIDDDDDYDDDDDHGDDNDEDGGGDNDDDGDDDDDDDNGDDGGGDYDDDDHDDDNDDVDDNDGDGGDGDDDDDDDDDDGEPWHSKKTWSSVYFPRKGYRRGQPVERPHSLRAGARKRQRFLQCRQRNGSRDHSRFPGQQRGIKVQLEYQRKGRRNSQPTCTRLRDCWGERICWAWLARSCDTIRSFDGWSGFEFFGGCFLSDFRL